MTVETDHTTDTATGDVPPSHLGRRQALGVLLGAAALAACGSSTSRSSASSTSTTAGSSGSSTSTTTAADTSGCTEIPDETGGPYPGDGTNGPNVLTQDGVVRSDIRSSFGSATGTAAGVPLTMELEVVDASNGCKPIAGAAVYAWHCDREGRYSLYSSGLENVNYLRGVQETDSNGKVKFTSIFPAAYSGRWPHVHFEVYSSLAEAVAAGTPVKTSQLAFPKATCDEVYATDGYETSVRNLAQTSLASDMVFSDGYDHQLATMTGNVASGYAAALQVGVS